MSPMGHFGWNFGKANVPSSSPDVLATSRRPAKAFEEVLPTSRMAHHD
jgi:hypothetical protein